MQREVLGLVGDTVKFCGLGDISLYSLKMNEVREIVFTVSFSPSLLQEHKKGTSAPEPVLNQIQLAEQEDSCWATPPLLSRAACTHGSTYKHPVRTLWLPSKTWGAEAGCVGSFSFLLGERNDCPEPVCFFWSCCSALGTWEVVLGLGRFVPLVKQR